MMAGSKFKEKWLDAKMPLLILSEPKPLSTDLMSADRKGGPFYSTLSKDCIVLDKKEGSTYMYIGLGIVLFFLLIWLVSLSLATLTSHIVLLLLASLGVLFAAYGFYANKKEIVFDRKTGTLTVGDWFYLPERKIPLSEVNAFWTGRGGASGAVYRTMQVAIPNANRAVYLVNHCASISEAWSFIVWYLDRNRPLPPGDAFDQYRQDDFTRRRDEGFPPPLYKSSIPTPEANPAQQEERERFWKEEDYHGTSDSAWL